VIYAASGFFGDEVFKSTDGAATWFPINNGLVTLGNLDVRSLVMDTTDPQTLYLTGVTGLGSFKTNDGGANWTPMAGWGGFALAIDPFVPSTLYGSGPFASTFNFLKSTDSGGTWFLSNNGITDFFCYEIRIDPADPTIVYAATDNGDSGTGTYVVKSVDSGANWAPSNTGLGGAVNTFTLTIDPMDTATIYAGSAVGVFKTSNGGPTWVDASVGLPLALIRAIAIATPRLSTQLQTVSGLIQALAQPGGPINGGQANALISKIENALATLNRGAIGSACNQLQAFLDEVNALLSAGELTPEEANPLINLVEAVRNQIPCS